MAQSEAHEALSLKEAEDYARDDLGIEQVDYSDFDQRTANEVNATLEVLRDKYPEAGGIEYLGSTQGRNEAMRSEDPDLAELRSSETRDPDSNEVAVTLRETPGYNGISMNRDWSGDYDKANRLLERMSETEDQQKELDPSAVLLRMNMGTLSRTTCGQRDNSMILRLRCRKLSISGHYW